ncbi:hypothetical protein HHI36_024115, partial [Cryptolaemus montrouzieri]
GSKSRNKVSVGEPAEGSLTCITYVLSNQRLTKKHSLRYPFDIHTHRRPTTQGYVRRFSRRPDVVGPESSDRLGSDDRNLQRERCPVDVKPKKLLRSTVVDLSPYPCRETCLRRKGGGRRPNGELVASRYLRILCAYCRGYLRSAWQRTIDAVTSIEKRRRPIADVSLEIVKILARDTRSSLLYDDSIPRCPGHAVVA